MIKALLAHGTDLYLKDPVTMSGFSQNKIISEILYLAWFEDKRSQGPVLSEYFNPIPLETIALIFTMVCEFLILNCFFLDKSMSD
jgi:hypothetical protein